MVIGERASGSECQEVGIEQAWFFTFPSSKRAAVAGERQPVSSSSAPIITMVAAFTEPSLSEIPHRSGAQPRCGRSHRARPGSLRCHRVRRRFQKEIERKVSHFARRARLPHMKVARIPNLAREVLNGNYWRYSGGWRSIAKDLAIR